MKSYINKIILKFQIFIWAIGLMIPGMYILLLNNLEGCFRILKIKSKFITFLTLLLSLEVISIILSYDLPFFSWSRFFAATHNIIASTFIFLGIYFTIKEKRRIVFLNYAEKILKALCFVIILTTLITIVFDKTISYYGFPGFLGLKSKFNLVTFNTLDYFIVSNYPRTRAYSFYPNGTAITLIILFILVSYRKLHSGDKKDFFLSFCFVFSLIMTASRLFILVGFALILILFFMKNKNRILIVITSLPVIILVSIPIIEFLLEAREGSNSARSQIYIKSLEYMWHYKPIIGLGIKPILSKQTGVDYPLGSHSMLIGNFVRFGLIGGILTSCFYLTILASYFSYFIKLITNKTKSFNQTEFFLKSSVVFISILFLTEDFDAIETIPLFCGSFAGIILSKNASSNESKA